MTATKVCQCWKIERRDGRTFGFTDHDEDVAVDGLVFRAAEALTPSEARAAVGFDVDEMEVQGGFSSASITDAALENGEFDGAEVWVYRVDWSGKGPAALESRYRIGKTTRAKQGFVCEMRSRLAELSRDRGRHYLSECDAELGDGRCKVDLGGTDRAGCRLTQRVTVLERIGDSRLRVSGLEDPSGRGFVGGLMVWDGADFRGHRAQVRGQAEGVLSFWQPRPLPEAGTACTLTAGCDKTFGTCDKRFANGVRFRGFPNMPSTVAMAPRSPRATSARSGGGK